MMYDQLCTKPVVPLIKAQFSIPVKKSFKKVLVLRMGKRYRIERQPPDDRWDRRAGDRHGKTLDGTTLLTCNQPRQLERITGLDPPEPGLALGAYGRISRQVKRINRLGGACADFYIMSDNALSSDSLSSNLFLFSAWCFIFILGCW